MNPFAPKAHILNKGMRGVLINENEVAKDDTKYHILFSSISLPPLNGLISTKMHQDAYGLKSVAYAPKPVTIDSNSVTFDSEHVVLASIYQYLLKIW